MSVTLNVLSLMFALVFGIQLSSVVVQYNALYFPVCVSTLAFILALFTHPLFPLTVIPVKVTSGFLYSSPSSIVIFPLILLPISSF